MEFCKLALEAVCKDSLFYLLLISLPMKFTGKNAKIILVVWSQKYWMKFEK